MTDHGTLEIRSVGKRFDVAGQTVEALSGIDLAVAPGEFVSIVGASGCGKSTLLRLIVGLERDYDGEILLKGRKLAGPTLDRAIVFQEHRLFPWLRVEENVALGLLKSTLPAAEKRKLVREHLELVGLGAFAKAYPAQLSGGMQQRLSIAQAVICEPKILLLDEPFGALDPGITADMHVLIRKLWCERRMTIFMVSHDIRESFQLGTRLLTFDRPREDPQSPEAYGARITYDIPLNRDAGRCQSGTHQPCTCPTMGTGR
jgi:ABC-type nitrate/sulfonate/bicarbonate transport system ATPase subunit